MKRIAAFAVMAVGLVGFVVSTAAAQEKERSRPWVKMEGRNAGAVGTCPDVDGGEGDTCYIVRCEPKLGMVFVIQHPGIADEGLRSAEIKIGKYKQVVRFEDHLADERFASFSAYPDLLKAVTSGKKWAEFQTKEASFEYSTEFELTHAKAAIAGVEKKCHS